MRLGACAAVRLVVFLSRTQKIRTLAKALSPAFLRFGGTRQDFMVFDPKGGQQPTAAPSAGTQSCSAELQPQNQQLTSCLVCRGGLWRRAASRFAGRRPETELDPAAAAPAERGAPGEVPPDPVHRWVLLVRQSSPQSSPLTAVLFPSQNSPWTNCSPSAAAAAWTWSLASTLCSGRPRTAGTAATPLRCCATASRAATACPGSWGTVRSAGLRAGPPLDLNPQI